MPQVAAIVGYEMPHFDEDFFVSMTPTLLGVADSMELMPFMAIRWFEGCCSNGITRVETLRQGERVIMVHQSEQPLFCVGEPMRRQPWVSVVSQGTLQTYVVVAWDDDGMTYQVRALIAGQEETEGNIYRAITGGGQTDSLITKRKDGTLAAMSKGVYKSNRPWHRMAFGLPWNGHILQAANIVLGDRRIA